MTIKLIDQADFLRSGMSSAVGVFRLLIRGSGSAWASAFLDPTLRIRRLLLISLISRLIHRSQLPKQLVPDESQ